MANGSDAYTQNYGWTKPQVDGSDDTWGDKLNANLDSIDADLYAVSIQQSVNEAPTDGRNYVRNGNLRAWYAAPLPSVTPPAMDGTAAAGTSATFSRGDHVHPTDTSLYPASNPANYINATQAASAAPVQSVAGHAGAVTLNHLDIQDWTSATATFVPDAPSGGPYGRQTGNWVIVPPEAPAGGPWARQQGGWVAIPPSGIADAPAGGPYARQTGSWVAIPPSGISDAPAGGPYARQTNAWVTLPPSGAAMGTSPPASPVVGQFWYDLADGQTYCYVDDGNTRQWVVANNQPGAYLATNAATPPSNPAVGQLWFDTVGAQTYVWYDDGSSKQWIVANNMAGAYLPLQGGTMVGAITLAANAAANLQPVTLQQMNAAISPLATQAQLGNYLPLAGGTLNGSLFINGNAVIQSNYWLGLNTTGYGALNNVNSLNWTTSGLITECSNSPLFANKIGSNGTAAIFMQGGTGCGSITVANATSTAYNTSSDARLKEDFQPFDAGPILDALEVHDFAWKQKYKGKQIRAHGVLAQDAAPIFPDAFCQVPGNPLPGATSELPDDLWMVDYSKFVPLLLQEIKALRARVAALEGAR